MRVAYNIIHLSYLEILLLNVLHLLGAEESFHVALIAIHTQYVQAPQGCHLSHNALNTGIHCRARHASKLTRIDRKQKGSAVELSNTNRLQQQIVMSSAVIQGLLYAIELKHECQHLNRLITCQLTRLTKMTCSASSIKAKSLVASAMTWTDQLLTCSSSLARAM